VTELEADLLNAAPKSAPEPDFLVAARTFYDTVAEDYYTRSLGVIASKPLDRAMLAAFAELVKAHAETGSPSDEHGAGPTAGPVAEIGCGPGTITAHLHSLGLDTFGIDLSPRMIALARRTHPGLQFIEGSMTALPLDDGSMRGIVPWYSTIHIPDPQLPDVFVEFRRVLMPGGHLLLAFQVRDEPLHLTEAFGHQVTLDFRRRQPERVAELLTDAGFDMVACLVREPWRALEQTRQAFLLARKPIETTNSAH
jgi:SAM-dependent methyltransferase